MAEQLQLRRGTASQVAAFTGAQGEIVVDTTNNRLVVNDGSTAGGFPAALETVKQVNDAAYTAVVTDRQIAYSALTAARTVTLPAASAYPAGATLTILDESGACSSTNTITAARAGSDVINGSATSAVIASAYGALQLQSNGSNGWTIVDQSTPQATVSVAQSPHGAEFQICVLEQLVSGLSGSSVIAGTAVPAYAIVFGCASRVVTTITGPSSFSIGLGGGSTFGGGLSLIAGSSYSGECNPSVSGAPQAIVLTPSGGNFTAGAVRLSLMYMIFTPPTS